MSELYNDRFWSCGEGRSALDDATPLGQENALQKLGKPPFEKTSRGRFRLLGYLATVYEHVASEVSAARQSGGAPTPQEQKPRCQRNERRGRFWDWEEAGQGVLKHQAPVRRRDAEEDTVIGGGSCARESKEDSRRARRLR